MKLAGILVLYNPTENDVSNIYTYIDFLERLYVIDNSEQSKKLNFNNPKIRVYAKNENMGIAKAFNIGCNMAIKDGFKWVVTIDQDTLFNKKTIEEICSYISNNDMSKTAIVSPWLNTKLLDERPKSDIDHPNDVMSSGSFLNLEIYEKIRGFKEWLFIDGVDIAYCWDARRLGYHIDRLNYVSIDHNLGNITIHHFFGKKILCTNHSYIRKYYMQRNYRYLRDIYAEDGYDFDNMPVDWFGIFLRIFLYENDKIRKLKAVIRGKKDYIKGITGKYLK